MWIRIRVMDSTFFRTTFSLTTLSARMIVNLRISIVRNRWRLGAAKDSELRVTAARNVPNLDLPN